MVALLWGRVSPLMVFSDAERLGAGFRAAEGRA